MAEYNDAFGDAADAFGEAIAQITADVNLGGSYNPPWTPTVVSASGHFGLPSADSLIVFRVPYSLPAAPSEFLGYLGDFYGWYAYGSHYFGDYYYWGYEVPSIYVFYGAVSGFTNPYVSTGIGTYYPYYYGYWGVPAGYGFNFLGYLGSSYAGYGIYSSGLVYGLNFDFTLTTSQTEPAGLTIGQQRYDLGFGRLVPMEPIANRQAQLIPDESLPASHDGQPTSDVPGLPGTLEPVEVTGPDVREVTANAFAGLRNIAFDLVNSAPTGDETGVMSTLLAQVDWSQLEAHPVDAELYADVSKARQAQSAGAHSGSSPKDSEKATDATTKTRKSTTPPVPAQQPTTTPKRKATNATTQWTLGVQTTYLTLKYALDADPNKAVARPPNVNWNVFSERWLQPQHIGVGITVEYNGKYKLAPGHILMWGTIVQRHDYQEYNWKAAKWQIPAGLEGQSDQWYQDQSVFIPVDGQNPFADGPGSLGEWSTVNNNNPNDPTGYRSRFSYAVGLFDRDLTRGRLNTKPINVVSYSVDRYVSPGKVEVTIYPGKVWQWNQGARWEYSPRPPGFG